MYGGQGLSQHVVQFQRDSGGQVAVGPSDVGVVLPFGPVIIIIKFIIIISNNTNLAVGQVAWKRRQAVAARRKEVYN